MHTFINPTHLLLLAAHFLCGGSPSHSQKPWSLVCLIFPCMCCCMGLLPLRILDQLWTYKFHFQSVRFLFFGGDFIFLLILFIYLSTLCIDFNFWCVYVYIWLGKYFILGVCSLFTFFSFFFITLLLFLFCLFGIVKWIVFLVLLTRLFDNAWMWIPLLDILEIK